MILKSSRTFLSTTCKCKLGPEGKPCCLSLTMDTITRCRDKCAELSHNELDLVDMSQVHYLRTVEQQPIQKASSISRVNAFCPVSSYYIHGVKLRSCFSTESHAIVTFASLPCTITKVLQLVYMAMLEGYLRMLVPYSR